MLHSPQVASLKLNVEVKRRAKLFYLRDRVGKTTRGNNVLIDKVVSNLNLMVTKALIIKLLRR